MGVVVVGSDSCRRMSASESTLHCRLSPNSARIFLKTVILASRVDHDLILYTGSTACPLVLAFNARYAPPPPPTVDDASVVILSLQAANDTQTACLVVDFRRGFATHSDRSQGTSSFASVSGRVYGQVMETPKMVYLVFCRAVWWRIRSNAYLLFIWLRLNLL